MPRENQRGLVLEKVSQGGVSIRELVRLTGVSESTVRRHVRALCEAGELHRVATVTGEGEALYERTT